MSVELSSSVFLSALALLARETPEECRRRGLAGSARLARRRLAEASLSEVGRLWPDAASRMYVEGVLGPLEVLEHVGAEKTRDAIIIQADVDVAKAEVVVNAAAEAFGLGVPRLVPTVLPTALPSELTTMEIFVQFGRATESACRQAGPGWSFVRAVKRASSPIMGVMALKALLQPRNLGSIKVLGSNLRQSPRLLDGVFESIEAGALDEAVARFMTTCQMPEVCIVRFVRLISEAFYPEQHAPLEFEPWEESKPEYVRWARRVLARAQEVLGEIAHANVVLACAGDEDEVEVLNAAIEALRFQRLGVDWRGANAFTWNRETTPLILAERVACAALAERTGEPSRVNELPFVPPSMREGILSALTSLMRDHHELDFGTLLMDARANFVAVTRKMGKAS